MLASDLARLEPSPELTVALRKLLESNDAAVRAALPQKTADDTIRMVESWRRPN